MLLRRAAAGNRRASGDEGVRRLIRPSLRAAAAGLVALGLAVALATLPGQLTPELAS